MNLRHAVAFLLGAGCLHAGDAKWIRLDAQNFSIISDGPEDEIRSWAVEFDQFHHGLERVLKINEAGLQPVTVVLFRSQRELRPYKPLEKGKPAMVDGMFMRTPLGNFIECADDSEDEQTRRVIFHEAVHWMTNTSDTELPVWLNEGLAEVFSTFSVDNDLYNYGRAIDGHVILLNRDGMMPLKQLMGIQRNSLLYNEGERTSIFYAESWAFVHYLLFSGQLEERTKYNQLIRSLRVHADPDAVFIQIFGVDCAAMDKRLAHYLRNGAYTINRIRFDRSAVNKSFRVGPASRADVNLAECNLLSATDRPSEALRRLREVVRQMPDNPASWESEGYAAYQTEDYGEAESSFRQAATLGSRDYFVYSFLGDAALGIYPGRITASAGGDPRQAADYYEHELVLNPHEQHAYVNMAENAFGMDELTDTDVKVLQEGARFFPDDMGIKLGIAVVDLKRGRAEAGQTELEATAADMSPANKDVSKYARTILYNRSLIEGFNKLQDLWQAHEYEKAIALANELLKQDQTPANRDSLMRTRDNAKVAMKVQQGVDLANSGEMPEAKKVLAEALSEAGDQQMRDQIQGLIDRMASASERRSQ
jgi:tetratricopeptide (TPR) repeat protein